METTKENIKTETAEDKREFINIAVTKEQKTAIQKEAIEVCGISISEYCRTKILTPKADPQAETVVNTVNDEERELYEVRMKKDADTIKKLTEENVQLKVSKSIPVETVESVKEESNIVPACALFLNLTPDQRKIVDIALALESKSFFGDSFADLNHFIKKKIGDLITSNQNSFPAEYFEKGTPEYQTAFDFINFLKEVPADGK